MDDKDDTQVLNIINNIYNSRFDYIIKKENINNKSATRFVIEKIIHNSKQYKMKLNVSEYLFDFFIISRE